MFLIVSSLISTLPVVTQETRGNSPLTRSTDVDNTAVYAYRERTNLTNVSFWKSLVDFFFFLSISIASGKYPAAHCDDSLVIWGHSEKKKIVYYWFAAIIIIIAVIII